VWPGLRGAEQDAAGAGGPDASRARLHAALPHGPLHPAVAHPARLGHGGWPGQTLTRLLSHPAPPAMGEDHVCTTSECYFTSLKTATVSRTYRCSSSTRSL